MTTGEVVFALTLITLTVYLISVDVAKNEEPKTPQQIEESVRIMYDIKKITLEGHEYWHFSESRRGGGICHSESCRCKKEEGK